MTAKRTPHVLQDQVQFESITRRVKRAKALKGDIVRMLEEGRSRENIVTQMAAAARP